MPHPAPRLGSRLVVDDRLVHVLESGSGTPVVVLHGCCSLAEEMMAALEPHADGLRLIAPDRPGYGFSHPLPDGDASPAAQADWLARLMDRLGLERAFVLAHSLGSAPALRFGRDHADRLAGLMLVAPFCRPTEHFALPLMRALLSPVVGDVLRGALLPRIVPLIGPWRLEVALRPDRVPDYLTRFPFAHAARPEALRAMAAELVAFCALGPEIDEAVAAIAAPVSVVVGDRDAIADPVHHVDWLAGLVPGTEVTVMPGVGHTPHHADPALVTAALRALIARAGTEPAACPLDPAAAVAA